MNRVRAYIWILGGLLLGYGVSYFFQAGMVRVFLSWPDYLFSMKAILTGGFMAIPAVIGMGIGAGAGAWMAVRKLG